MAWRNRYQRWFKNRMAGNLPILELSFVQCSVLVKQVSCVWHWHSGNCVGTWLRKTFVNYWQWTVIVEKLIVIQLVNKFSPFQVFRLQFYTHFLFLHAAMPLFTVGFYLLLRAQTKTNKYTHTHTRCPQLFSHMAEEVGLPTHEAKTVLEPSQSTCKSCYDRSYEMAVLSANVYLQRDISTNFTSMYRTAPLNNQTIKQSVIRRRDIIKKIHDLLKKKIRY
jgi:hypothetical protein